MNDIDEELDETIEPDDISIGSDNSELDKLYEDFNEKYPIEKLRSLTIEEYTNLKEVSEDYFCTWVERKTQKLGSMQNSTPIKFGIYKFRTTPKIKCVIDNVNKYAWAKQYEEDNEDHTHYKTVFERIRQSLVEIAEAARKDDIDFATIDNSPLAQMFKWKVAFLYSKQRLLPVYAENALEYLAQEKGYTLNKETKISEVVLFLLRLKKSTNIWDYSRSLWQFWDARIKDAYNDFPVERWLSLFDEPSVFYENSIDVLKKILELGGKATCKQLADKYGETPEHYNGICIKLAGRIAKRLGLVLEKKSGSETRWKILFDGQKVESGSDVPGNFIWILKPNLKAALVQVGKIKPEEVKMIEEMTKILNLKKNIILQGAPGTGKTYKTAALALSILGESGIDLKDHAAVMKKYNELLIEFDEKGKIKNDGQIGFVTFHQSMDYEDFVEGIKPRTTNEQVTYDVESGIFKSLCTKAKPKYEDTVDNFEDIWKRLVDELDEKGKIPVPLLKGTSTFDIELNEYGDGLATRTYLEGKDDWERGRSKFFSKDQLYRVYQNLPGIPSGGHDNYRKAIIKELKKNYGLLEFKKGTQEGSSPKNYVLIIDEINRGNVSKIFGELISLLETDKRVGGDHPLSVTLPYSKEPFSVPSNLYIIGTMNTTDRSVGSIDYAVRRRFAFVTLEADESAIENYYKGKDESLKNKAIELFGKVKDLLSNKDNCSNDMEFEDLMVGHSYFMAKTIEELELKWKYEVVPLLKEYQKDGLLRHSAKIDDLLK